MWCSSQVPRYPVIASQWIFLRRSIYLLTTLTTCEMFGLVQTMTYIMLSIALAYGTCDMYSISSLVYGNKELESLKWVASWVLIGFYPCIPNCSNTFSIYFLYDKYNCPASMSLWIFIPNIFFATPRSFI